MKHKLLILISALFIFCGCSEKDVNPKSSAKAITSFRFNALNPVVEGVIDSVKHEIHLTLPQGTDLTKLSPSITISDKATVSPQFGEVTDFSKEVIYTVTAEDGSKQTYTVYADKIKSSENNILSFSFNDFDPAVVGEIDSGYYNGGILYHEIWIEVPWTGNTKFRPTIVVSEGATVFPESGTEVDFSEWGVEYTVTAENGTKKTYQVYTNYDIDRTCEQSRQLLDLSGDWKVSFARNGIEIQTKESTTITFKDDCTYSISGNKSLIEAADNSMNILFNGFNYKLYMFEELRGLSVDLEYMILERGYNSKDFSHLISLEYDTFKYGNGGSYHGLELGVKVIDENQIHLTTYKSDKPKNGMIILRRN